MPEATVFAVTRYGGDRTPESPNWEEPWPLSAATGRGPSGREPEHALPQGAGDKPASAERRALSRLRSPGLGCRRWAAAVCEDGTGLPGSWFHIRQGEPLAPAPQRGRAIHGRRMWTKWRKAGR